MNSTAIVEPVRGLFFSRISQSGCQYHFSKIQHTYLYKGVTMGLAAKETKRTVWLWTKNKDVMTASMERGWDTFIFTPETQVLYEEWKSLAKIRSLFLKNGKFYNEKSEAVALFAEVSSVQDLQSLRSIPESTKIIVINAKEWQIINSENMVASFQHCETSVFFTAKNADEARIYFESLEKGTDGVVLQVEDASEVFALKAYLKANGNEKIVLVHASVQRVEQMGMGDRVCVDLCSLLVPGEGLLVGSFARGLFLVHSECLKSDYVASRPFRVNAGPVHAYVAMPGGKTSYLAELESGMQVLVVDAYGKQRTATVGRIKIERRPLILVEAVAENDKNTTYSLLLQNAETVSLVRRPEGAEAKNDSAISVTKINSGEKVLLSIQESARHTGMAIDEFIVEK